MGDDERGLRKDLPPLTQFNLARVEAFDRRLSTAVTKPYDRRWKLRFEFSFIHQSPHRPLTTYLARKHLTAS